MTCVDFALAGPGQWEAEWRIPPDASGTQRLGVTVIDVAANVRTQPFEVEVVR